MRQRSRASRAAVHWDPGRAGQHIQCMRALRTLLHMPSVLHPTHALRKSCKEVQQSHRELHPPIITFFMSINNMHKETCRRSRVPACSSAATEAVTSVMPFQGAVRACGTRERLGAGFYPSVLHSQKHTCMLESAKARVSVHIFHPNAIGCARGRRGRASRAPAAPCSRAPSARFGPRRRALMAAL